MELHGLDILRQTVTRKQMTNSNDHRLKDRMFQIAVFEQEKHREPLPALRHASALPLHLGP